MGIVINHLGNVAQKPANGDLLGPVLNKILNIVIVVVPIRDRKTTVRRVEFFTPFDRKLLSDFSYIKNFLRRCSNSGEIV